MMCRFKPFFYNGLEVDKIGIIWSNWPLTSALAKKGAIQQHEIDQ